MNNKKIEIEVLIEFKEYLKLNYAMSFKQLKFIFIPLLPVFLCNFSTVLYFFARGGSVSGNTVPLIFTSVLFLVIVVIFVAIPILIYLSSKRNMETQPFLKQKINYSFTENQIESEGNSFKSRLSWEMISRAQEIAGFFVLSNTKATFIPIPLRCFQDAQQTKEFRELLDEKLGDKAKLKK